MLSLAYFSGFVNILLTILQLLKIYEKLKLRAPGRFTTPNMQPKEDGMPSIEGLEVLFAGDQLTQEKWCKFLEIWRKAIEPWLEKLALKPIGQLEYLSGHKFGERHRLDADLSDSLCGLKARGIFPYHYRIAERPGIAYFWGIGRMGKWLLCKMEYDILKSGYERATQLWVVDSSIEAILLQSGFSPLEIAREVYARIQDRATYYTNISLNLEDIKRAMNTEREAVRRLFHQLI